MLKPSHETITQSELLSAVKEITVARINRKPVENGDEDIGKLIKIIHTQLKELFK